MGTDPNKPPPSIEPELPGETRLDTQELSSIGRAIFESDARKDAEDAFEKLAKRADRLAVLLAQDWQATSAPFIFEHMALYQAIAARAGLSLVAVSRPQAEGFEHLLFLARTKGLADADYFNCIDDGDLPMWRKPMRRLS